MQIYGRLYGNIKNKYKYDSNKEKLNKLVKKLNNNILIINIILSYYLSEFKIWFDIYEKADEFDDWWNWIKNKRLI